MRRSGHKLDPGPFGPTNWALGRSGPPMSHVPAPRAIIHVLAPGVMIHVPAPGAVPASGVMSHTLAPGSMIHVPAPKVMGPVRGPGWALSEVQVGNMFGIKSPQAQINFWGPGRYLGDLAAHATKGRLVGGSGAEPPGI